MQLSIPYIKHFILVLNIQLVNLYSIHSQTCIHVTSLYRLKDDEAGINSPKRTKRILNVCLC